MAVTECDILKWERVYFWTVRQVTYYWYSSLVSIPSLVYLCMDCMRYWSLLVQIHHQNHFCSHLIECDLFWVFDFFPCAFWLQFWCNVCWRCDRFVDADPFVAHIVRVFLLYLDLYFINRFVCSQVSNLLITLVNEEKSYDQSNVIF